MESIEQKEFQILTYKVNHQRNQTEEGTFFKFLCIFKVFDEHLKAQFLRESKEYIDIAYFTDESKYKEYYDNLTMNLDSPDKFLKIWSTSGLKHDDVWQKGFIDNHQFLEYKEKFDVFIFREYFSTCPTTLSIIEEIKVLKNCGYQNTRTTNGYHFYRLLKTLDNFWD